MNYSQRLEEIESEWLVTVPDTARELTSAHAEQQFYTGAFWLCYVDYTMFGVPCFAMNTEAHVAAKAKAERARQIVLQKQDMEFTSLKKALGELG